MKVATRMPLLAGKLAAPSLPGRVVARPRLFARLDAGVQRPVTLVAAPAGAGKTILLTSWTSAGSPPGPVAWLSLDPGDNDPQRFWTYLLAALCRSGAVPAGSGLRALRPRQQDDDGLLPSLVHGLEELASPVVLVLDDVHELTDARVLQGLDFLVRHVPPQLRLVLSTRADPPLPLHRLLLAGALTELRGADLAFTLPEVGELFAGYDQRPSLSDDDLAILQARTEGWAAGLRLAAVSMQTRPDPHRYVLELAGDDHSLAGYLVTEVLDQLPAESRGFLLRTCIVDELSGELADALTGRDDGERTLAELERANVFVMALGSRRGWYRYHRLFAELLRYQLRREEPQRVTELHRRAAAWYAGHGLPVDAIQQTVTMRDWGYAAELIAEIAADDEAAADLQLAREQARLLADDRRPRFTLVLATCRLLRARRAGDLDEVLAAGREALDAQARLGDPDAGGVAGHARAVALSGLGAAELWTGELDAAEAHLRAGQAAARWAGLEDVRLGCLSHLALLHAVRGRLSLAVRTAEAAGAHAGASPPVSGALLALAWVHYQRDDLATATGYLERAAEAAGAAPAWPLEVATMVMRGRLWSAQADPARASAELDAARQALAGRNPPRLLVGWLAATDAEIKLAAGHVEAARAVMEEPGTPEPAAAPEAVTVARLQLAAGDPAGAIGSLTPLLDGATPAPDLDARIRAWLLHASASHALDLPDQAAASLGRAVDLAAPEDHRRIFLDAGAPGRALLASYRNWLDASWPFLDELAHASLDPAPSAVSPMPALVEPLSERERVVLRYLPTMLTFVEIGSELFISVNTTKSHARNIYRKLGAVGRRDAVRRARQLQLLRS